MLPPSPPSPPLGPPRGTNFSRRKAMQPCPPSPAFTVILASSMNMKCQRKARSEATGLVTNRGLNRLDVDEAAAAAFVFELNDPGYLREQRVVFADADVHARFKLRSALTDQNRAAADELPAEALDAEPLR